MAGLIGRTTSLPVATANVVSQTVILTGSGTYTVPNNVRQIRVRALGGGGGGGGVDGQGAGTAGAAGGGGSGGYVEMIILSPTVSYTYSIGTGGTGGAAGANTGSIGNNTTFTGTDIAIIAEAGTGGTGKTAGSGSSSASGGAGGNASGGDINIPGESGRIGRSVNSNRVAYGDGAASVLGSGGYAPESDSDGNDGTGFGTGGGGAVVQAIATDYAGGDGADGTIIIEEFYAIKANQDFTDLIASPSEAFAGTSNTILMTPQNNYNHPGVVNSSIDYDHVTPAILGRQINITSITDNGTGDGTTSFTNVYANIEYIGNGSARDNNDNVTVTAEWIMGNLSDTYSTSTHQWKTQASEAVGDFPQVCINYWGELG